MLKTILGTFSSKVVIAIINFGLVIATAQLFGAEGRGIIALFITNLAVTSMTSKLVGGTALIYLTSRISPFQLAVPSYIWGILTCIFMSRFFLYIHQIPEPFVNHLLALSILDGLTSVNYALLSGRDKIKTVNLISVVHSILHLLTFTMAIYFSPLVDVRLYFTSLYIPYALACLVSFIYVWPLLKQSTSVLNWTSSLADLFKFSFKAQFTNIILFLNYRLSYYFINTYLTVSSIGIFSIGSALSESIWLISTSISTIQYIKIANHTDIQFANFVSIQLAKVSFWSSAIALTILLLIPATIYVHLFGNDFVSIKPIILGLSSGILAMSLSSIFAHYFMGLGRYEIELYASLVGLATTLIAFNLLMPVYGLMGASIAASLSYVAILFFLYYKFKRATNFEIRMLLPDKNDVMELRRIIATLYNKAVTSKEL